MKKSNSLFNDLVGKVQSKIINKQPKNLPLPECDSEGEVDYLWISEEDSQAMEKPVQKKDPRIDTGILKARIKEKVEKLSATHS